MTAPWRVLLGAGVILAGCSAPDLKRLPVSEDDPKDLDRHLVQLDSRGEGQEPDPALLARVGADAAALRCAAAPGDAEPGDLLRHRFRCVIGNALAQYRRWTDGPEPRLAPGSVLKLLVYFNGGLNDPAAAIGTAADTYLQAEREEIYPIYMVWPTGAWGTYREDVVHVRAGRWSEWDDPWTLAGTPLRPVSDLARGIAATPAAWGTSFHEFWNTGFGLGADAYRMAPDGALLVRKGETVDAERQLYFSYGDEEGAGAVAADRVNRDIRPGGWARRAGGYAYYGVTAPVRTLSTPFMVGLGEAGWRNMVRRTRTSVRSLSEFPPELAPATTEPLAPGCGGRDPDALQRCFPRGAGGFARFFQWLESCTTGLPVAPGADPCPLEPMAETDRASLRNMRLTLIGHSMGAIVVNEILQAFPNLPYEALVYMAGAATVRDTARAVTPVLQGNRGCTKFFGLMLHPMNESREPTGGGLLVSGSLLTYVDEFLETPKTLPDRTVGRWHNLRTARHLFPETVRPWMLLRVYDREAATSIDPATGTVVREHNPTTHGAFNDLNMPFWNESFWKPNEVQFRRPATDDCEGLFAGRLNATAAGTAAGTP